MLQCHNIKPLAWQQKALDDINNSRTNRVLLQAPTGAGKAYLIMFIAKQAINEGKSVLLLVDRIQLLNQLTATACVFGIELNLSNNGYDGLTIMMIQSWIKQKTLPFYKLIIQDECHTQYNTLTNYLKDFTGKAIGLTATPYTAGLRKIYPELITTLTADQLTRDGILCPLKPYEMRKIDMTGAEVVKGEWLAKDVQKRSADIYGDAVRIYRNTTKKRGLIFCANISHCQDVAANFKTAGINAEIYTSAQSSRERNAIMRRFDNRETLLLITVAALSKGFDRSYIEVIMDLRPLRQSISEYIQMIGRGLRNDPNKTKCILIDFSGNWGRFKYMFNEAYFNGSDALLNIIDAEVAKRSQKSNQEAKKRIEIKAKKVISTDTENITMVSDEVVPPSPRGKNNQVRTGSPRGKKSIVKRILGFMGGKL